MDNALITELLALVKEKGEDKKIVSFFVSYAMDLWKHNWKLCQKTFLWITIDDFTLWQKNPEKCIEVLLGDEVFLIDIRLLIDTYTDLYIEKTKRKIRAGRPEVLDTVSHCTTEKLQKRLNECVSTSSMGRKIRMELNKRGVYGAAGRK